MPVPSPVRPDYGGACLTNMAAALRAAPTSRPSWLPGPAREAPRVVLLLLDGLGWHQLAARPNLAPVMWGMAQGRATSVTPTTTATALTSLTTGMPPSDHGVVGYRVRVDGDEVMNVLRWRTAQGDARERVDPAAFCRKPAFPPVDADRAGGAGRGGGAGLSGGAGLPGGAGLSRGAGRGGEAGGRGNGAGGRVPVVTRAEFATTGFTVAHLSGTRLVGWRQPSTLVVEVLRLAAAGEPFVYAYYDGIDRVAHEYGLGQHWEAEVGAADRLVGDLLTSLPGDVALVVTADHGQVDVGGECQPVPAALADACRMLSGEGRFRWLHTVAGAAEDVAQAARGLLGSVAWVFTRNQLIDEGWLGGTPASEVMTRLGDVALVPFEPIAFLDPTDPGESRLVSRHGSLTAAEMEVPLLAQLGAGPLV